MDPYLDNMLSTNDLAIHHGCDLVYQERIYYLVARHQTPTGVAVELAPSIGDGPVVEVPIVTKSLDTKIWTIHSCLDGH